MSSTLTSQSTWSGARRALSLFLCLLTRLALLVCLPPWSRPPPHQHPFRSLISQLTFSSPAAFAALACSLFTNNRRRGRGRHPQGLLWRASSNVFHSFDRP